MNLNNIKRLLRKYFIFIFIFAALLITLLIYILLPKEIAQIIYLSIFLLSLVIRIIIEMLYNLNQIKIKIDNKQDIVKKLYELFDLENTNTIVVLNTRDKTTLTRAKQLFPGSRETKQKNVYSILLPKVTLKTILLFLKDNNPERLIIHQFNKKQNRNPKSIRHTLSMCIDDKLIIRYGKNIFTKEKINKIKTELIKSK